MKFYGAFIKKDKNHKIKDIAIVGEGFSKSAFFLGLLWFLFHKMWKNAIALIVIEIIFGFIKKIGLIGSLDLVMMQFFLFIVIGFNARHWLSEHLQKNSYQLVGFVLARSEEEARLKAMKTLEHNYQNLNFSEFADIYAPKKKEQKFA